MYVVGRKENTRQPTTEILIPLHIWRYVFPLHNNKPNTATRVGVLVILLRTLDKRNYVLRDTETITKTHS